MRLTLLTLSYHGQHIYETTFQEHAFIIILLGQRKLYKLTQMQRVLLEHLTALLSAFNKILHPTQVIQVKGRGGFNTYLFGRVWFLFKTDNPHKVNQNVRIDLNLFFNFFFLSSNLRFHLKNNTSC